MLLLAQSRSGPPLQGLFVISRRVHVFQNQSARIKFPPLARVNMLDAKLVDRVGNFAHTPREGGRKFHPAFSVVDCSQRLDSAVGPRNDCLAARAQRPRKQPVKPFCGKIRHVAGEDQIPRRTRRAQSGDDSRERSISTYIRPALSFHLIRDHAQPELRVSARSGSINRAV